MRDRVELERVANYLGIPYTHLTTDRVLRLMVEREEELIARGLPVEERVKITERPPCWGEMWDETDPTSICATQCQESKKCFLDFRSYVPKYMAEMDITDVQEVADSLGCRPESVEKALAPPEKPEARAPTQPHSMMFITDQGRVTPEEYLAKAEKREKVSPIRRRAEPESEEEAEQLEKRMLAEMMGDPLPPEPTPEPEPEPEPVAPAKAQLPLIPAPEPKKKARKVAKKKATKKAKAEKPKPRPAKKRAGKVSDPRTAAPAKAAKAAATKKRRSKKAAASSTKKESAKPVAESAARYDLERKKSPLVARLPPGLTLPREFKGEKHRVTVQDGSYRYRGKTYPTLYAVTCEIAGVIPNVRENGSVRQVCPYSAARFWNLKQVVEDLGL